MTAPLERRPAPDMVRDLTLCGLAQQSFCADTVWCLTCWRWLFKQSAYTGGADRQNYIAAVLSSLVWAARKGPPGPHAKFTVHEKSAREPAIRESD